MNAQEIWDASLAELELIISKAIFNTWFKCTRALEVKGTDLIIAVPSIFNREWLDQKHAEVIIKTVRSIAPEVRSIKYLIKAPATPILTRVVRQHPQTTPTPTMDVVPLSASQKQPTAQLALVGSGNGTMSGRHGHDSGINPRYRFENFIVGPFNELAHAAAQSVANSPGTRYNPLFVYGGVGLGKTHLLQSIGNRLLEHNKNAKVLYISSEKFTSDLVNAIRSQTTDAFQQFYRQVDLLIIDDVQFIAGKEKTQEEFFHTFNHLYQSGKQIVLSSDRPPKSIPTLEGRLRSRFEGGMPVDIGAPDYETRVAILRQKCEEFDVLLDGTIIDLIATKITQNIRELEGALNRLVALNELGGELSKEKIEEVVAEFSSNTQKSINPQKIIDAVALHFDINKEDLLRKNRRKEIAMPRQLIMYLLRTKLQQSFPEIGRRLGGRDHTTVMYAVDKIERKLKTSQEFKEKLDMITDRIYNY